MSIGISPSGYPYPNGDDPIRNGDNVARQLAEALPRAMVIYDGGAAGVTTTTSGNGRLSVVYPAFATPPALIIYALVPGTTYPAWFSADSVNDTGGFSTTRATWTVFDKTGVTIKNTAMSVRWWAIGNR